MVLPFTYKLKLPICSVSLELYVFMPLILALVCNFTPSTSVHKIFEWSQDTTKVSNQNGKALVSE